MWTLHAMTSRNSGVLCLVNECECERKKERKRKTERERERERPTTVAEGVRLNRGNLYVAKTFPPLKVTPWALSAASAHQSTSPLGTAGPGKDLGENQDADLSIRQQNQSGHFRMTLLIMV